MAGKEESIFKRQPNLLCNAFHWITNPEKRWPEHFWACDGVRVKSPACQRQTRPTTLTLLSAPKQNARAAQSVPFWLSGGGGGVCVGVCGGGGGA